MGDLYGLLDVEAGCTAKQVSTAYRKASLKYHPDKLKRTPTEDDKEHWLLVQKAYDTLTDPVKKKKYDSSIPFDDKIPPKDLGEEEFYEKYGRCFVLNGKFSEISPIPVLGNKHTPMNEVHKFYNFWDSFKSWRVFSQYDEFSPDDIENAYDRYEKRYMEKENKKL